MANLVNLPANIEAERTVLGSMIIDKSALAIGASSLTEESFSKSDMRNRYVFRAIKDLVNQNQIVDVQTVHNQLLNLKLDREVGSPQYLYEMTEEVLNPDNVDHYINIVKDQAALRNLLLASNDFLDQYSKDAIGNIGDFLTEAKNRVENISNSRSVGKFQTAKEIAEGYEIHLSQIKADGRGLTGVDTGFARLNECTHGWQKGDLIIVAARPSVGKTALGLNFAYNAAARGSGSVAFFSLEMTGEKIIERLIANRATVKSDRIQTGKLTNQERVKIHEAVNDISRIKLFIDDTPDALLGDIVSKATKLKAAHPDLSLIIVDYLGKIHTRRDGKVESREREVAEVSLGLKNLARNLKFPVISLCQLNRNVESSENKRPELSHLRESGSIEADADIVILLYRADYYSKKAKKGAAKPQPGSVASESANPLKEYNEKSEGDASIVEALVKKNRNGELKDAYLLFEKAYSRFSDPDANFEQAYIDYIKNKESANLD